jgi:Ca2+-transporting ATPase
MSDVSADELWSILESGDVAGVKALGGVSGVVGILGTDAEKGISSDSIEKRVEKYGTNDLPEREMSSFFDMLKDALSDGTIRILILCAFLSLTIEFFFAPEEEQATAWIDGAAILGAVAIVSFVQAYSNYKQELQFSAVNRIKCVYQVTVCRDGIIRRIQNTSLVVGDIVDISQGDRIPADGLLLQGDGIKVDQSAATGESVAVFKNDADPFFISNTFITEGRARFVVICVGPRSHHGRIFDLVNSEARTQTPLQEKLEDLAKRIGVMGIIAASCTFLALLVSWLWRELRAAKWAWSHISEPLSYFIVAITIVACAVPEGLPLAVTISLAYSMRKMMDDNNFVRHLSACETMGSATVICTDKTGTLTQNQMNVERVLIGSDALPLDRLQPHSEFMGLLKRSISVNSHAVVSRESDVGSQTECALFRFVVLMRQDALLIRKSSKIARVFEFDRNRKMMSTVEHLEGGKTAVVHVKGAPDEVLPRCRSFIAEDNQVAEMSRETEHSIRRAIDEECLNSYRCVAVAFKSVGEVPVSAEDAESGLTLIAVLCLRDSLRRNTAKAIRECQRAGIRVIMVTGDHLLTAEAIARECRILRAETACITGAQLRQMPCDAIMERLPSIAVVARSTPMDKHLLVVSLQKAGEVVGVTGDGTNDVAALMAADVGLAMGKCGTELAKEASDIVVLDDDFGSIVKSVVWGRGVYDNIQKFLQFQLTANVSTLFISFWSAVVLRDTPFKAVQLLWVNMIMDSLGALALATGRPGEHLLDRRPHKKDTPILSMFMIRNIGYQALLQIILIGFVLAFPIKGVVAFSDRHYTFLFNVFVYCQVFNLVNSRATEQGGTVWVGMADAPFFFGIMLGIGMVQAFLVQLAGPVFSCTPLEFGEWALTLGLAALTLPLGWVLRRLPIGDGVEYRFQRSVAGRDMEDSEPLLNQIP